MKFFIFIISVASILNVSLGENPGETEVFTHTNGVYALSDTTIEGFLKSEASVLVLFYAPWCHWCLQFLPKYPELARLSRSQSLPLKLAQIDGSKYRSISDANKVTAFPSLVLFLDTNPHYYEGSFSVSPIMKWLTSHLQTNITVSTNDQLDTFIKAHPDHPILIAHFNPAGKADEHRGALIKLTRKKDTELSFAEVNDRTLIKHLIEAYKAPQSIEASAEFLLMINPHFHKYPETEQPTVLYSGDLDNRDDLDLFVKKYLFPALTNFDAELAPRAFNDGRPIWVLFTNGNNEEPQNKLAVERTRDLGSRFRHQFIFISSDGNSVFDKRLLALLNVENEKLPTVRLFHANPKGHSTWYSTLKYRPSAEVLETFNIKELEQFISDFQNNKLKPFIRSEPIPEENEGPVKILVATQFEDLVYKTKSDVLVEFHAPWCGHCHQFSPTYKKVGKVLSNLGHIEVMKIDATRNEVNVTIWGYPTLILFTHDLDNPDKTRLHYYEGDRSFNDIIGWVGRLSSKKFDLESALHEATAAEEMARDKLKAGDALDWMVEEL